jgi:hypothetical protein
MNAVELIQRIDTLIRGVTPTASAKATSPAEMNSRPASPANRTPASLPETDAEPNSISSKSNTTNQVRKV